MKIEITKNDISVRVSYGDLILRINDEVVKIGNKREIFEKLNKILITWFT